MVHKASRIENVATFISHAIASYFLRFKPVTVLSLVANDIKTCAPTQSAGDKAESMIIIESHGCTLMVSGRR